ncbi:HYC_CC_PP family protein [Arcticibacterium luteifluviistationis]|uniref:Uncharacterized protein n=1 Tax=Arcticibacterium luteifluviistationis TaxID=1784714 RepID=A0A2Z4GCH5_9BACT|nr:hypothetical protein [Arcticibacterium luteifluviistationis]AWV98837.1 hypothetical protein DJ013_11905 [Arcticibacterium luteifluviistationis]
MRISLKVLAVFMALNIVFSATGLAMFEHTCHAIGLTTSSFTEEDSCSMEVNTIDTSDGALSFKQNECCETHAHFKNLDLETSASFQNVAWPVLKMETLPKLFNFNAVFDALPEQKAFDFLANAPPNTGRKLLIKIQTFLL